MVGISIFLMQDQSKKIFMLKQVSYLFYELSRRTFYHFLVAAIERAQRRLGRGCMASRTEDICRSVAYLLQLYRTGNRVFLVSELVPLAQSLESWGRYAAPQQISSVPEIGIQYHLLSGIVFLLPP